MMLGVFKKNINKTNASIIELSKDQQITFNVPTNSELKIQMDMLHISKEDLQVVKVLHYSLLFMQKLIGLLKNSMPTLQNNLI
ncbi:MULTISPECIES: hypothetical protein [Bacillus cereus group]|uniref:hypothetical protein n=1 Tax=Bacillus cereus group TaxID=86661 RepID=UPI0002B401A1|nr:Methyl-accepting chemotaxis protein [Bacillus thuringiensis serovar kurstaki str. HD73]